MSTHTESRAKYQKYLIAEYQQLFFDTFHIPIEMYLSVNAGFDVYSFVTWIKKPEKVAIGNFVTVKYGNKVWQMIEELQTA